MAVAAREPAGSARAQLQRGGDAGARRHRQGEPERRGRADQAWTAVSPYRSPGVPGCGVEVGVLQEVESDVRRGRLDDTREVFRAAVVIRCPPEHTLP